MKALQVQIQPNLSPGLDVEAAVAALSQLDASAEVSRGDDSGPYVNIRYCPSIVVDLWTAIGNELKTDQMLARATIVVCEGSQGWDNYLLLHHFDADEPLDQLG